MPKLHPRRAFLIDVDGCILDSERQHRAALEYAVGQLGLRLYADDYATKFAGLSDRDGLINYVGQYVPSLTIDTLVAAKRTRYAELAGRTKIFPGAELFLATLGLYGAKMAAVTSSSRADLMAVYAAHPELRGRFNLSVTEEDVRRTKPSPEPYITAAMRLGVEMSQAVVIEDSPAGIASALEAGAFVVAVKHTHSAEDLQGAHLIVDELTPQLAVELLGIQ